MGLACPPRSAQSVDERERGRVGGTPLRVGLQLAGPGEAGELVQHATASRWSSERAIDARPERVLLGLDTVDDLECDGPSRCRSPLLVGRAPAGMGAPNRGSSARLVRHVPPTPGARSPSLLSLVPASIRFVHAWSRPFVRTQVDTRDARGV